MRETGGVLDRSAVLAAVPDVPPPGAGATWQRFAALADAGRDDLARTKLVESHLDALAILHELAPRTPTDGCLWAVWAAEPPTARLRSDGAVLDGDKAFCSGAAIVDRALVTVPDDDGSRLFVVDVAAGRDDGSVVVGPDTWVAGGMARSGTRTLTLSDVPASAVGGPGDYTARPGFWHGAAGVAACWHGGTLAVADLLLASARRRADDPLVRRQLADVAAEVAATDAVLRRAAEQVDGEVRIDAVAARLVAELTRARAVTAARRVLDVARTALGPGPLAFDPAARDVTEDLAMFVLQHHGDRDLAALGGLVLDADRPW